MSFPVLNTGTIDQKPLLHEADLQAGAAAGSRGKIRSVSKIPKCDTQQCFSALREHHDHLTASSHTHHRAPLLPKSQTQQFQGWKSTEFMFLTSSQGDGDTAGQGSHLENTNTVYTDVRNKEKESRR